MFQIDLDSSEPHGFCFNSGWLCFSVADVVGMFEEGVVPLEHGLREAVAIADVDEDLVVVAAIGIGPAVEDDGLAEVGFAKFAARMGPLPR